MRIFSVVFLSLFLPAIALGVESEQKTSLLPLFNISPVGELQIKASSNVLLAIAEGEEAANANDAETVQYVPWSLTAPRQNQPDWSGLGRDTLYIIGLHWVVIGILYVSPQEVSRWSEDDKDSDYLAKWQTKVQEIVWDDDDFYVNYILHPYWGATYYTRGRERGLSEWGAFWFSTLQSVLYEFGTEAFFENPSIQDLIVTPVFGSLLGIYFEQVRDRIKLRKGSLNWSDKTLLVVTDPLGGFSYLLDRLFRIDSSIRIQTTPPDSAALAVLDKNATTMARNYQKPGSYLGLSLQVNF